MRLSHSYNREGDGSLIGSHRYTINNRVTFDNLKYVTLKGAARVRVYTRLTRYQFWHVDRIVGLCGRPSWLSVSSSLLQPRTLSSVCAHHVSLPMPRGASCSSQLMRLFQLRFDGRSTRRRCAVDCSSKVIKSTCRDVTRCIQY